MISFIFTTKHFTSRLNYLAYNYNELKKSIEVGHYDMLSIGSLGFSIDKLKPMIGKIEKKLITFLFS